MTIKMSYIRYKVLADPEMSSYIDVHRLPHHCFTAVQDLVATDNTGVVYQNINTTHFTLHLPTDSKHLQINC